MLDDVHIVVPLEDRVYLYFITYDSEAYLSKDVPETTSSIHWQNRHLPLSISVCSNVPGYTNPMCFVSEGSAEVMVQEWISRMLMIASAVEHCKHCKPTLQANVGPTYFCSLAYGWPNVWAPTIKQRWPNIDPTSAVMLAQWWMPMLAQLHFARWHMVGPTYGPQP